MFVLPRNISQADLNKFYLRANSNIVNTSAILQAFSLNNNQPVEFFANTNEVIVLPRNSGIVLDLTAAKFDYRLDGSVGRYGASLAVNSNNRGDSYTLTALHQPAAGTGNVFDFVLGSVPGVVQIAIDQGTLPNAPNQRYLRFQTRGVLGVDIQFILKVQAFGTQSLG